MTEKQKLPLNSLLPTDNKPDTWAGALKEFFRQLGSVTTLLIIVLAFSQACGTIDIYRLLGK